MRFLLDCQKSQSVKAALVGLPRLTFFHTAFNTTPSSSLSPASTSSPPSSSSSSFSNNPATELILQALKADSTAEYVFIALGSEAAVTGIFKQVMPAQISFRKVAVKFYNVLKIFQNYSLIV